MNWLASLPHQIPFRAASALVRRDETTLEGDFLCTANDSMPAEAMLIEAMAQFAGGLVFREQGFVSGIDSCEIARAVTAGDVVRITVSLEASFGGIHRFRARGVCEGVEVVHARFYLAEAHAES